MPGRAAKVTITERQQEVLRTMTRASTSTQALAQRAGMILRAFDGLTNADIAERLGCERHAVGAWRRRWARAFDRLVRAECCEGPPRCGAPSANSSATGRGRAARASSPRSRSPRSWPSPASRRGTAAGR